MACQNENCQSVDWLEDFDNDGFGNPEIIISACNPPEGFVDNNLNLQDSCFSKPYIEPYWDFCPSNDVCELESWPIIAYVVESEIATVGDSYSFSWENHTTNEVSINPFINVRRDDMVTLKITFLDGCVYLIDYVEHCN